VIDIVMKHIITALVGEKASANLPPKMLPKNIPNPMRTIINGTRSSAKRPTLVTIGEIYVIHENKPPVPIDMIATINHALVCLKYDNCCFKSPFVLLFKLGSHK